jgi:DUF4097 and DUF4098 domain-containing protein YvlB
MTWYRFTLLLAAVAFAAPPVDAQSRDRTRERERERAREVRERERERIRHCDKNDDNRCDDADEEELRSSRRGTIDTSLTIDKRGVVDLTLASGTIVVTGWARSDARVKATTEYGQIKLDAVPSRITLDIRSRGGRVGESRYEVSVPFGTRVLTKSMSGETTITGVRGEVEAQSQSGDIVVSDANERINLEAVSGSVTARRLTGSMRLAAVSGDIQVTTATGDLQVETVSGEITLDGVSSKFVRTETTSGDVEFDGVIDPAGRYEFRSHSGDIRVTIPPSAGAAVDVETFSGSINSDFRIVLEPGERAIGMASPKRFDFKVGDGSARISLESFSGDVRIVRGGQRSSDTREP